MIDDVFKWLGVAVTALMAATFAWHGIKGSRDGSASTPLSLFSKDDFARGETMYGLALAFNFFGAIGAATLSYAIWSGML